LELEEQTIPEPTVEQAALILGNLPLEDRCIILMMQSIKGEAVSAETLLNLAARVKDIAERLIEQRGTLINPDTSGRFN
jgi:hypothetical protein